MSGASIFYIHRAESKKPWLKVWGTLIPERYSGKIPMFFCRVNDNEILTKMGLNSDVWCAVSVEYGFVVAKGTNRREILTKLSGMTDSTRQFMLDKIKEAKGTQGPSPLVSEKAVKNVSGGFF